MLVDCYANSILSVPSSGMLAPLLSWDRVINRQDHMPCASLGIQ
jgi:hypothetical protein